MCGRQSRALPNETLDIPAERIGERILVFGRSLLSRQHRISRGARNRIRAGVWQYVSGSQRHDFGIDIGLRNLRNMSVVGEDDRLNPVADRRQRRQTMRGPVFVERRE
jgi:hypothetical protein